MLPNYSVEARIGGDFLPAITYLEYFYSFVGVAHAWQAMFFVIARDTAYYWPIIWIAVVEKLSFGILALMLFAPRQITGSGRGRSARYLVRHVVLVVFSERRSNSQAAAA